MRGRGAIAFVMLWLAAACTTSTTPPVAAPLPVIPTSGGPDPCANPYLPVNPGDAWYYTIDAGTVHDTYADTVTTAGDGYFIITSNYTLLAQDTTWSCGPDGLSSLDFGGGVAATVSTMTTGTSVITRHPRGLTLPADPSPGDRWIQTFDVSSSGLTSWSGSVRLHYQALRMDRVAVPAGRYRALLIHVHAELDLTVKGGSQRHLRITSLTAQWYVRDVGLVRQDTESHLLGGTTRVVQELVKFEEG